MSNGVIYNHETVVLDGQDFSDCEFRESRLVFGGGEVPSFSNCRFDACEWKFDDDAGRTFAYLKLVWGLGEKSLVQGLIKDITGGGGR